MVFSQLLDLSNSADTELAQRARSETGAFDELYRRHVARVYRYHLVRTGNVPEAQDLTAQTFLAALEGITGYRGDNAFAAWLISIARHKVADHYRSRKPEAPLEEATGLPHPDSLPEDYAIAQLSLVTLRHPDTCQVIPLPALTGQVFGWAP